MASYGVVTSGAYRSSALECNCVAMVVGVFIYIEAFELI